MSFFRKQLTQHIGVKLLKRGDTTKSHASTVKLDKGISQLNDIINDTLDLKKIKINIGTDLSRKSTMNTSQISVEDGI